VSVNIVAVALPVKGCRWEGIDEHTSENIFSANSIFIGWLWGVNLFIPKSTHQKSFGNKQGKHNSPIYQILKGKYEDSNSVQSSHERV